jgi:MoxR-like ATPase
MTSEGTGGIDSNAIRMLADARERIVSQLSKVIVGQDQVIEELLISLFSRGHCLLEGVPGLAKTLLISTLSQTLSLSFSRIQFTPDLMPADITGTDIIEENRTTGARERRFLDGPLFSNVVLADEINRTPPKTQAALLEAMQEQQVTVGRTRSSKREPTRCQKRSKTGSCSKCSSTIPGLTKRWKLLVGPRLEKLRTSPPY